MLACSALRQSYRDYLEQRLQITWVFLSISEADAQKQFLARKGHFMKPSLIKFQFNILESPLDAIVVNATDDLEEIVSRLKNHFYL